MFEERIGHHSHILIFTLDLRQVDGLHTGTLDHRPCRDYASHGLFGLDIMAASGKVGDSDLYVEGYHPDLACCYDPATARDP